MSLEVLESLIGQISTPEIRQAMSAAVGRFEPRLPYVRSSPGQGARSTETQAGDTSASRSPAASQDELSKEVADKFSALAPGDRGRFAQESFIAAESAANLVRSEALRQARLTFNVALSLSIVGVMVIALAIVLLLFGAVSSAIISTIVAALSEVVGGSVFVLNRDANLRLDRVSGELHLLRRVQISVSLLEDISDPEARAAAAVELLRSLNTSG